MGIVFKIIDIIIIIITIIIIIIIIVIVIIVIIIGITLLKAAGRSQLVAGGEELDLRLEEAALTPLSPQ